MPSSRYGRILHRFEVLFMHRIIAAIAIDWILSLLYVWASRRSAANRRHKAARSGDISRRWCVIKALVLGRFRWCAFTRSSGILALVLKSLLHQWRSWIVRRWFIVASRQIRWVGDWWHQMLAPIRNVLWAGALLQHSKVIIGVILIAWLRVCASNSQTATFLHFSIIITGQRWIAWLARIQIFLIVSRRRRSAASTAGLATVLAKLVWLTDDEIIVDRMEFRMYWVGAHATVTLGMYGTSWSIARLIANALDVIVLIPSWAIRTIIILQMSRLAARRARHTRLLDIDDGLGWLSRWRLWRLLKDLQFGQWYDITILWLMPHSFLRWCVVIVKAVGLRIEKLPPLWWTRAFDRNILWEEGRGDFRVN